MSPLGYIIKRFFGNLWEHPLASLGSFLSLFLLYLLFDLAWVSSLTATKYYDQKISELEIEVFLNDEVADSVVPVVMEAVASMDGVGEMELVSREAARSYLGNLMGVDLLEGLDINPLPRSLVISFTPVYLTSARLDALADDLRRIKGVDEILFPGNWLEKAEYFKKLIRDFLLLLGALILIAVVLNSVHSVILSARTRLEELVQLQLLGAGPVFLTIPFILEGVFYSLTAAAVAWLVTQNAARILTLGEVAVIFPGVTEIVYFCLAAAIIGLLGGYMGVRRSL